MATITAEKTIFEMSPKEFEAHLKPVSVKARQTALDSGAWFSYKNELCVKSNMFIREFKDGHKELVQLGDETGKYKVLKVF